MPPKKKEEPKERPVLGRFKSNLKVIVERLGLVLLRDHVQCRGQLSRGNHQTAPPALQVGIVGLPNVGKSTLFNVISKLSIPAENFPFCTIEPNVVSCLLPEKAGNKLQKSSLLNLKSRTRVAMRNLMYHQIPRLHANDVSLTMLSHPVNI